MQIFSCPNLAENGVRFWVTFNTYQQSIPHLQNFPEDHVTTEFDYFIIFNA